MPLKGHLLNIMDVDDVRLIRDHAAKSRHELKRLVERLPVEYRSYSIDAEELKTPGEVLRSLDVLASILNETWEKRSGKTAKGKTLPSQHKGEVRNLPVIHQGSIWDERFNTTVQPKQTPKIRTETVPSGLVRTDD